jgi:hypothetical protein
MSGSPNAVAAWLDRLHRHVAHARPAPSVRPPRTLTRASVHQWARPGAAGLAEVAEPGRAGMASTA